MKKLLSIALLLFSIAAPSATYSDEAPRNPGQTFERLIPTPSHPETQKEESIKLATRKRRCCALLLSIIASLIFSKIFLVLHDSLSDTKFGGMKKVGYYWPHVVISIVFFSFVDLFFKYLLGMKIVDKSGKDASWIQLLIRYIVRSLKSFSILFLSGLPQDKLPEDRWISLLSFLWYAIQAIIILVREDRRGPHDLAAKTVVVMRDESTSDSNKSTLA